MSIMDTPFGVFAILRSIYSSFPGDVQWIIGFAFGGFVLLGVMKSFNR